MEFAIGLGEEDSLISRLVKPLKTAALLAGVLVLASCSDTTQQSSGSVEAVDSGAEAVAEKPAEDILIIGLDDGYAPMTFIGQGGELQGFDIDLAKAVMAKTGLPYEFKAIDWGEKEAMLNETKEIDMIWSGLNISDERKKIFGFSTPYLTNATVAAVPAGSDIQVMDDLGGKTVGLQTGTFAIPLVKDFSGTQGGVGKIVEKAEISLLLSDLIGQTVDAVVIDSTQILYFMSNTPGKFRVVPGNFSETEVAVATRKGDRELIDKLDAALQQARNDGTYDAVYQKWFGEQGGEP